MTYRQFTEYDEWRDEHWHFWIPVEGNERILSRLADYLANWADYDSNSHYSLGRDLTEAEVDLLIEYACTEGRRHPDHTKVDGYLSLSAELEEHPPEHWFYGTKIRSYFAQTLQLDGRQAL